MSSNGGWGIPGQGSSEDAAFREIIWGGMDPQIGVLKMNTILSSTLVDAGNTPTYLARSGLLLGEITSTGEHAMWDATATDGTQYLSGVLTREMRMQNWSGTAVDRWFNRIVRAPLIAANLLVKGTALTSATDQYLARQMLYGAGCVLDDDPMGYKSGLVPRFALASGTTLAPTAAADNGKTFYVSNAASVTVTLPALVPGLRFRFIRTADEEIIVASTAGDDIVVGNDLSADSITITTAGQQIGACVDVFSSYINTTTLKWVMHLPNMPFGTGLTGGFAYSIAT